MLSMFARTFNANFNSIKVRIERSFHFASCHPKGNFNSIKVRLEQTGEGVAGEKHVFQFHKGTIRTKLPRGREGG